MQMAGSSSQCSAAFQWGDKVAGSLSSYESMYFKGVCYDLYDCVFVRSGLAEPHLGKLMRLFEDNEGVKKVRLRWFIRPSELPGVAKKDIQKEPNIKEVFIAQGNFKGVENENVVEVLLGKASVLCTAKFQCNPVPSQLHVDRADYVFNRVYDVSNKRLGKIDKIDRSLARKLFNKPEWVREAQNAPRDGCRSPTSVTDFDMVGNCGAPLLQPPLKSLGKRPPTELHSPPRHIKMPAGESSANRVQSRKDSLEAQRYCETIVLD